MTRALMTMRRRVVAGKPVRTILTIVMDLLVVLAVLVTAAIVVAFFGTLASQAWGKAIVEIAGLVTIPFGFEPIKTPYGGQFLVDAAIMVAVLLLGEWVLAVARQRS